MSTAVLLIIPIPGRIQFILEHPPVLFTAGQCSLELGGPVLELPYHLGLVREGQVQRLDLREGGTFWLETA